MGAMAIGAVLGTALGVDMLVKGGIDRYQDLESEWMFEARTRGGGMFARAQFGADRAGRARAVRACCQGVR